MRKYGVCWNVSSIMYIVIVYHICFIIVYIIHLDMPHNLEVMFFHLNGLRINVQIPGTIPEVLPFRGLSGAERDDFCRAG